MKDAWLETITSSFLVYAVTDSYTFLFRSHPGHNLGLLSKLTELRADTLTPGLSTRIPCTSGKIIRDTHEVPAVWKKGQWAVKSTWSYAVRTVFH